MKNDAEEEYKVQVQRCPVTGNAIEENWYYLSGERGRRGAPARLVWDPYTQNLVASEFWDMGMLSSPLSGAHPAHTSFDALSGLPTCKVWMRHSQKHRIGDMPAVEFFKDGRPIRHEFWLEGQLFRNSGPAILNFDPMTGEVTSTAERLEPRLHETPNGNLPNSGPS